MGIEIEKKYRLSVEGRGRLERRLREVAAVPMGEEFEDNTLYAGANLDSTRCVLRLRRVGDAAIFTYKERSVSDSAIRHQREDETRVEDAGALEAILDALGYRPALVYEKRRATWRVGAVELVIDELPFGLYLEIEGEEKEITGAEALLGLTETEAELETYPDLTRRYGEKRGDLIEARFSSTI